MRELLRPDDFEHVDLIEKNLQEIDVAVFAHLRDGNVLFVDSTHVSKTDSDVNHLLFKILPSLERGVYIHFHDIPYPFEYPRDWVYQGRAWNEAYILRAFLQYNSDCEIAFFNSFLANMHAERLFNEIPQLKGQAGTRIWLRRR